MIEKSKQLVKHLVKQLVMLLAAVAVGLVAAGVAYGGLSLLGVGGEQPYASYDDDVPRLMSEWKKGDECGWRPRYFFRDDDSAQVLRDFWGKVDSWKIKRVMRHTGRAAYFLSVTTTDKMTMHYRLIYEPNLGRTELVLAREATP